MENRQADVLVLFGITGDLARKLVLPALYRLTERGELTVPIIGVALTDLDTDGLRRHVADCVHKAFDDDGGVDDAALKRMTEHTELVAGDYADPSVFTRLADAIGPDAFAVHYLAVPPSLFGAVADGIAAAGLAPRSRLIVEKPFGHDLASARALNERLSAHYPEDRLFRVDHFLGKEPVEDLLVLRFANTLLEPLWNREWIDHFEITMAEDFDVADRGSFYDAVGTVRDVVQNHLLQVLAYLMMEPPLSEAADDQRDAKHGLLRATRAVDPAQTVRGRYDGYTETPGVKPGSTTETYVALTLHVDNWRWSGVPVYLRAGKDLPITVLDIVAVLRTPPQPLFAGTDRRPAAEPRAAAAAAGRGHHPHAIGQAPRQRRRGRADPRRRRLPQGARPDARGLRTDLRGRAGGRHGPLRALRQPRGGLADRRPDPRRHDDARAVRARIVGTRSGLHPARPGRMGGAARPGVLTVVSPFAGPRGRVARRR